MKSAVTLTLCLIATLVASTGCRRKAETPEPASPLPEPPRVAECEVGKRGGRLTLTIPADPKTFNPLLATDVASDACARLLFAGLASLDPANQQAVPALAESWSVDADGKTWTFTLRKALRWSDGQPLTADDVLFTWNDIMQQPDLNPTYELFQVGGKNFAVTKVDDLTIRVVTPEVFAPFLEYFATVAILPKHVLAKHVREKSFRQAYAVNTPPAGIVGCGPYRVKEYQPDRWVVLQRNPEYFTVDKQSQRLPYIDEVLLMVVGPIEARAKFFLDGQTDAFEYLRREDWHPFQYASMTKPIRVVHLGTGVDRDFLWFNQNTGADAAGKPFVDPAKLKWFREKKFRQAISCAIDRDRVIREVYADRAEPVYGFFSKAKSKWYNADVPSYGYDLAKARQLLGEIGMQLRDGVLHDADGKPVEIILTASIENPARVQMVGLIDEQLKELGIRVRYEPVDFPTLLQKVNGNFNYECVLMGFAGAADPAAQMHVLKSDGDFHSWFPLQKAPSTEWEARIDTLMDAQMRTLDFAGRKKCFDEVQAIWAEELPMISIAAPFAAGAARSNIANLRPTVGNPYPITWNIEELYFRAP